MKFKETEQISDDTLNIKLPKAEKEKIRAFAKKHNVTMTTAVIGVFNEIIRMEESIERAKQYGKQVERKHIEE